MANSKPDQIAIVTGANRGIGLEVSRQLAQQGIHVILTSRDEANGQAAVTTLQQAGLTVIHHPLEVTNSSDIATLVEFVQAKFGHLEILVNNAGILLESWDGSLFDTKLETLQTTMAVNAFAPFQLALALIPLMQVRDYGRIVNVSSGAGQLTDMNSGCPGYRLAKTALNAVTRILADELRETNILVNSACPGWVNTDMGGTNAPRLVGQGADTIAWLATQPNGAASGGFWRDRQLIPW
jgi:NAD(P)-dependent dehydrogenase (short-subunit alcohol dehydrogenase family)